MTRVPRVFVRRMVKNGRVNGAMYLEKLIANHWFHKHLTSSCA
jgi:hypothetical protein